MAEDRREEALWVGAFECVQVGVADRVCHHLEAHLARLRRRDDDVRQPHVVDAERDDRLAPIGSPLPPSVEIVSGRDDGGDAGRGRHDDAPLGGEQHAQPLPCADVLGRRAVRGTAQHTQLLPCTILLCSTAAMERRCTARVNGPAAREELGGAARREERSMD